MRKILYVQGQLDDLDVQWLSRVGRRRPVADGERIISQGEASPSLFILIEGALGVDVAGIGRVAVLQQGEILGEMSFVDSAPPSATVVALGEAIVLEVPKAALARRIEDDSGFGFRFYKAISLLLADRLRGLVGKRSGEGEVELDEMVLDTVSLAGDRFDRLLRRLAQAAG